MVEEFAPNLNRSHSMVQSFDKTTVQEWISALCILHLFLQKNFIFGATYSPWLLSAVLFNPSGFEG